MHILLKVYSGFIALSKNNVKDAESNLMLTTSLCLFGIIGIIKNVFSLNIKWEQGIIFFLVVPFFMFWLGSSFIFNKLFSRIDFDETIHPIRFAIGYIFITLVAFFFGILGYADKLF